MTRAKPLRLAVTGILVLTSALAAAQAPGPPSTEDVAKALGFADLEIRRIKGGEVISKRLSEESGKELAGVVAVFFKKPVGELLDIAMQGSMLKSDKSIQAFRAWKADESAEDAFAEVGLRTEDAAEAKRFAKASPGDKLNLSTAEIAQFKRIRPDPDAVNVPLRALLRARYDAYRQKGLKGIAPYTRGRSAASPAEELTLAIKETMAAASGKDFFEALLNYPADQPPNVEHRFYWFKQTVEDRPTFILAHRAQRHTDNAALMTEEQFYVGHSYNSNFVAAGGFSVEGGTLVFYVNRTFTDQVAGLGSGVKHGIGRGQMLSEVAANLKRIRGELEK
jgi:hypothetical protein